MIKNFLLIAVMLFTLASCSKDVAIVDLTLDHTTLDMDKGEIMKIAVETGNGKYQAESSNSMIAKVAVSGTTIAILGVEGGTATVTITDEQGKTETINVTVSYAIPNTATFIWNKEEIKFDNAGGYGVSILESDIAFTNIMEAKQYVLSWEGGMTEGEKTNGQLIIATPGGQAVEEGESEEGEEETGPVEIIDLVSVTVVLSEETGGYIVFNDGSRGGEIFFSR